MHLANQIFERFIKRTIKCDLFELTYQDAIFTQYFKDFIPRSDSFIDSTKDQPLSKKIEFVIQLVESMIQVIAQLKRPIDHKENVDVHQMRQSYERKIQQLEDQFREIRINQNQIQKPPAYPKFKLQPQPAMQEKSINIDPQLQPNTLHSTTSYKIETPRLEHTTSQETLETPYGALTSYRQSYRPLETLRE